MRFRPSAVHFLVNIFQTPPNCYTPWEKNASRTLPVTASLGGIDLVTFDE